MSSTNNPTPISGTPPTPQEIAQHTEQALVELVYVRTANDLIGSAMANLDQALNTTQSVLNILQALQNLHNQISVKSKSAFPFNFSTGLPGGQGIRSTLVFQQTDVGGDDRHGLIGTLKSHRIGINPVTGSEINIGQVGIQTYQKNYEQMASAYFGQAIDPFFVFTNASSSGFHDFVTSLSTLKANLKKEITLLTKISPAGTATDPASLLFTISKVYNELPSNFHFNTVEKWALDNYNQHGSTAESLGGQLQNDLTFAITAAENLNDTQKEKVRSFLFIFQEYYQSAAAVISGINQVATRIAQKISQ